MKKFVKIIIFKLTVFLVVMGFCSIKKYRIGGFRLSKILKVTADDYPLEGNAIKLDEIFANCFHYLGRGTQFYAFVSSDQKFVLKILRSDRLKPSLSKQFFSMYKEDMNSKSIRRKMKFLNACKIAFHSLKDQTGVIFLHLNSTDDIPKTNIVDNFGLCKKVDLNSVCFVIQKKAVLIKDSFLNSKKQNEIHTAKDKIFSFFEIIKTRVGRQISNTDPNVFKNFGFIGNQAVEVDFGDFYINEHSIKNYQTYKSEIDKHASVLRAWLLTFWPDLIPYFDEQYNLALQQ